MFRTLFDPSAGAANLNANTAAGAFFWQHWSMILCNIVRCPEHSGREMRNVDFMDEPGFHGTARLIANVGLSGVAIARDGQVV
jgi:hypothetical protein